MKLAKVAPLFVIIFIASNFLLAQTAPSLENGFKAFGSYQSGAFDTVNLQTGNLMFHTPIFSYAQRGKLTENLVLRGSSKNWQVGEWTDQQHIVHYKWILAQPAGVTLTIDSPFIFEVQRNRHLTTDFTGNQTYTIDGYAIVTGDGAWHWLSGFTPSGRMVTMDGSGIQLLLTPGSAPDHSNDTATVTFRDGTSYPFANISVPMPTTGQGNNLAGVYIQPELVLDAWGTTQTAFDAALSNSAIDSNGNVWNPGFDTIGHNIGSVVTTSDYSGCVTTRPITSATINNLPGPDGRPSTVKVCVTSFTPTAAFSQPNVDPPSVPSVPWQLNSYVQGVGSFIGSIVMPDGNHWSFDYDDFGNVTKITLPTGGTISYQWTEIPDTCAEGSLTRVSRAVSSRTVNDNNGHSYLWSYTWGALQQDGSITNYVLDPNGNETAHVFRSVTRLPCDFYEVETRSYQGTHTGGTLVHTVGTHYLADFGFTPTSSFPADVVPDVITTTLSNGRISKVVRQYDSGNSTMATYGKVIDEKVYDFGNGAPGPLLQETVTSYQWQINSAYLDAGFLDLPASVVVKDGAGCAFAETDYTYDEPNYLTAYTGTLPTNTHVAAPGGAIRGNLTTVTKWLAATSSCNPKGGTAITSHIKWYDTGVPYQTIDPLGHTTTLSYDSAYAGAYVTQTCSPATGGGSISHCVSGTYDFTTGLLESLSNENATTQANGNAPGDSAHTSNYTYDTSWRLIMAQAPPDPASNNARSTTSFTPSASNAFPLSVLHQRSVTAALTDSSTSYFDGLARVNQATHTLPNGMATVLTTYDGLGQPLSVTNPYFSTSDATYGTTSSQYDALGRVTQTMKQDGSISSVSYEQMGAAGQGTCTSSTDEAGKQRRTCADALGRLVEVDEPNPAAAAVAAQGALTINGTLQSHTSSGTPAVKAGGTVSIWSGDGSGADMHIDDPSEPCPPLPQTCSQIYDSGWVRVTVNGITLQTNYGQFDTDTSIASSLASAINGSGANVYVTASVVNSTSISLQAKNAGVAGNSITVSTTSASNDSGDFGGGSFGGNASGSTLSGGADAINPVTTYDQGTVTLTIGSCTASALYSQSGNSTGAQIATALVGTGSTGLNRVGSPVSAAANGASITLTYATAGAVGNGVTMSGSSQSTQTHWTFSPPSFSSAGTTLANGLNVGDVSNNPLVTLYQYDALGNLTCVEQHGDAATGTGCSAAPSADATSPWRVRRFTYDSLSRLLTATNPESGAISYSYDADGNVSTKTDARGIITSFYYDELHRITSKSHSDGSLGAGYVYDQKGVWGTPGNNAVGRLVLEYDGSHAATLFSYDALGRINQQWDCPPSAFGVGCPMVQANYDLAGDLTQLTYPNGEMANFSIDSAGRTLSAVDGGGSPNFVSSATYGPDSGLTGFVSGSGGAEAITSSFSYNKRLQPVSMSATAPSQTVFSIGYDFHAGNGTAGTGADNGNVWGIYNYRDRTRDQSFTYDPLNRLTSAQNAGANCAATTANGRTEYWGNSYSYDAWGNLTNKTITKCGAENLSVAALANNQLSGYSYDAAGNMTNDGLGHAFTYDGEGRISQINSGAVQYTYDPEMGRVRKDVSGSPSTEYFYFGNEIVAEKNVSTSAWTNYVFFDGERVARREYPAGNVFYYFSDHLKTASVITDASGTIKSESDYYPWGGELQFTANDSNHYKYGGHERDNESNLDYYGARYYGNALGRFLTPDWAAKATAVPYANFGNPQSLNLYAYTNNNPTTFGDVDGHCPDGADVCFMPQLASNKAYMDGYHEGAKAGLITVAATATALAAPELLANPTVQGLLGLGMYAAGTPTGQAVLNGIPEALAPPGANLSIAGAAESFGFKSGFAAAGNLVGGELKNGAQAAVSFSKVGSELGVGISFLKGPAGSLAKVEQGAIAAAKSQGASSLKLTATMVKDSMAKLLGKNGFTQELKDGKATGNWIKEIKIKKEQ